MQVRGLFLYAGGGAFAPYKRCDSASDCPKEYCYKLRLMIEYKGVFYVLSWEFCRE